MVTSSTQPFLGVQSASNSNTSRPVSNMLGESLCFGFYSTANSYNFFVILRLRIVMYNYENIMFLPHLEI
jgi:hypothetical protein